MLMSKRVDRRRRQPIEESPAESARQLEPVERKGRADVQAEEVEGPGPEPEEREEAREEEGELHESLDRGHVIEDKGLDR